MSGKDDDPVEILSDDPDEYVVEAIRARKKDPKTGTDIFLVKWEDYPETDNTWEPAENLKCPEIVQRFLEQEEFKKKRRKVETNHSSATKRPKREAVKNVVFNDDDTEDDDTAENDSTLAKDLSPEPALKGFERNLGIDEIVTASVGDDEKLYFFVRWKGLDELELIECEDLEKNAPSDLCRWYKEKFFCNIKYNKVP